MKNKNGFSLVELLVSMAILAVLILSGIIALNPQMLMGKANDAKRKADLSKIKKSFEEYYNDKGYYPSREKLLEWNTVNNCGKTIEEMSKYLSSWPCGPNNQIYMMITDNDNDWFKVVTNLDNKKDKDIPEGWYEDVNYVRYTASFLRDEVNYGVSSSNVLWYEGGALSICGTVCLKWNSAGCNDAAGIGCSSPDNCYLGTCSASSCRVSSCY